MRKNRRRVTLPRDVNPHHGSDMEWWYCYSFLDGEHGGKYAAIISFFRTGIIPFIKGGYLLFSFIDLNSKTRKDFSLLDKKLIRNMNLVLFPLFLHYLPDNKSIRSIYKDYRKYDITPPHILMDNSRYEKNPLCLLYGDNCLKYADEKTGKFQVHVDEDDVELHLTFTPTKPAVLMGGDGKPNQLYYYSYTCNDVCGQITQDGSLGKVTGTGWFDHQWGKARGLLTSTGWNWFGIQLDDGRELMVTELGSLYTGEIFSPAANLIEKDGSLRVTDNVVMEPLTYWKSPVTGAYYPIEWDISIPEFSICLRISADFPEQEIPSPFPLQAIWEGTCSVSGIEKIDETNPKPLRGKCFTELVGYASF